MTKKTFFTLGCLAVALIASPLALADDVAVMKIKFGNEKQIRTVLIDLYEQDAPQTVENFKRLAKKGFYKKVAFHRVFPGYLVQTGDPLSKKKERRKVGTGGPGYTVPAEIGRKVKAGALVTGRLPDRINPSRASNGSQFYIALQPISDLNGKETVFGEVISGIEILDEISKKGTDSNDYPSQKIVIKSVKIVPQEKLKPTAE